jgi:hypothetical protein
MAVTQEQVVFDLKELLKKYNSDTDYADRHLLYLYNLKRAKFLRQLYDDQTRAFDNITMQSFVLNFVETDKGLGGMQAGCTVMKSTKPIPQLLEVKNRTTLVSVQPAIVTSKTFKVIEFNQLGLILDRPFANGIYAGVDVDNYVYLVCKSDEHKLIDCLYFTAILEDPTELETYSASCSGTSASKPCIKEDTPYPAQSFLIDLIRDELVKLLITTKEEAKEDKKNNGDDD